MRNGQNKHRMRGRNRSGKNHNPLTRVYESNGPDVKIRGTANHVAEKYIQLARDATASGDPVAAENYYQHAEHYFRLIAAAQEQFRQSQPFPRQDGGEARGGEESYDGDDDQQPYGNMEPFSPREREQPQFQPREQREQPYPPRDFQPREQRPQRQPRQFDRNDRGDRNNEGREPRENRSFERDRDQDRQPQPVASAPETDLGLPSFITGASPQPAEAGGNEGQADRFPLNRRRRRSPNRGPRTADAAGNGDEAGQPGGE